MQEVLLGIAFVLALGWLVLRIRRNKAECMDEARQTPLAKNRYHAVSIAYAENACLAAKQMTGRRFLANAAPRLPLPECNALECRCNFAHHDDRRSGQDRRSPFSGSAHGSSTGTFEEERRSTPDRRNTRDPES